MNSQLLTAISMAVSRTILSIKDRFGQNSLLKAKLKTFIFSTPYAQKLIIRLMAVKVNYKRFNPSRQEPELFIDITCVHTKDLKTGIQRVVRSILNEIQLNPIPGYKVEPVFLINQKGFWHYQYVKNPNPEIVVPKSGDIFLGLDLNSNIILAAQAGMFEDWKLRNTTIAFVIYDILPILNPQWWPAGVSMSHERWLHTILRYSNKLMCISKSVCEEVNEIANKFGIHKEKLPLITWFHLGADINSSSPTMGLPDDVDSILLKLASKKTFLSVGTIEPRKGSGQTLAAFENIWLHGVDVNLVFVGKQGWMVDNLINQILNHSEFNKRLFWFNSASDEFLEKIYANSDCLIAASEGEGFGLPLIEAAQHRLPIIARDLPIFREVASEYAYYFKGLEPSDLAKKIEYWLSLNLEGEHPKSDNIPFLTWSQSAQQLIKALT